ncbi:MAG: response regulator [Methylotenera sp.]|nr:response regulator [Oligoflexia bacterium]
MSFYQTVMIVEDDDAIRDAMRMIVESEGYLAVTARNGKEALDYLRARKDDDTPCMILLDLMMPEMNGWEFLEMRRSSDIIAAIPVIVVTAASPSKMPGNANKVLRKPVDIERLLHHIDQFCSQTAKDEIICSSEVVGESKAG